MARGLAIMAVTGVLTVLAVLTIAGVGRPLPAAALLVRALAVCPRPAVVCPAVIRLAGVLPLLRHRWGFAVGAPVGRRDGDPDRPFDVAQIGRLVARAEGDGDAVGA